MAYDCPDNTKRRVPIDIAESEAIAGLASLWQPPGKHRNNMLVDVF